MDAPPFTLAVEWPFERFLGYLSSFSAVVQHRARTGEDALAFFDAIAPIVHRDSIDMSKAWLQSRYRGIGIYFGGAARGCTQANLTAAWVKEQIARSPYAYLRAGARWWLPA